MCMYEYVCVRIYVWMCVCVCICVCVCVPRTSGMRVDKSLTAPAPPLWDVTHSWVRDMCEMCDSLTVPAPEFVACVSTLLLQSLHMTESDNSFMCRDCDSWICEVRDMCENLTAPVTSHDRVRWVTLDDGVRVCDSFMCRVRDSWICEVRDSFMQISHCIWSSQSVWLIHVYSSWLMNMWTSCHVWASYYSGTPSVYIHMHIYIKMYVSTYSLLYTFSVLLLLTAPAYSVLLLLHPLCVYTYTYIYIYVCI